VYDETPAMQKGPRESGSTRPPEAEAVLLYM
jgi:hypothetical protein